MGSNRGLVTQTGLSDFHAEPRSEAHDILMAWLLWLPDTADVAAAARAEMRKIDQCRTTDGTALQLRGLLEALVHSRRPH